MTNNLSTTHPVKNQPSDNKNWEAHACTNPGNGMGETARKYREKHAARASELNGQEKTHSSEQISRHNCAERRLREHSSTSTREHMKSKMNIRRTLLTLMYLPRKKRCTSVMEKHGEGSVHRISRKAKKKGKHKYS